MPFAQRNLPAIERDRRSWSQDLAVGTRIEVRDRFRALWSRGFEVAERTRDGYRIRRLSDRYVLPGEFVPHEVRRPS